MLPWARVDPGSVLSRGSWNRAVAWRNSVVVLGDRERDIATDYDHRQVRSRLCLPLVLRANPRSRRRTLPTSLSLTSKRSGSTSLLLVLSLPSPNPSASSLYPNPSSPTSRSSVPTVADSGARASSSTTAGPGSRARWTSSSFAPRGSSRRSRRGSTLRRRSSTPTRRFRRLRRSTHPSRARRQNPPPTSDSLLAPSTSQNPLQSSRGFCSTSTPSPSARRTNSLSPFSPASSSSQNLTTSGSFVRSSCMRYTRRLEVGSGTRRRCMRRRRLGGVTHCRFERSCS